MNRNIIHDIEDIEEINTNIFSDVKEFSEDIRNDRHLNIIHFNIRSIKKNFDELITYLEAINIKKNRYHYIIRNVEAGWGK